MSMTETNTALQDKTIDVGFQMMGIPGSSLMEVTNMMSIKLIPIGDAELDKIIKARPAWTKGIIPANTYTGQKEDITTLKVPYCIYTSSDVSDEIVYEFTKQIIEHNDALKQMHVEGQHYSDDNPLFKLDPQIPYHPGAEKYLKEIGVIK
jgi:TRAP transporter TAXI family solute receptor